jgi:hypothetical protein
MQIIFPRDIMLIYVARDVMLRGGNAADSAVATMYCNSGNMSTLCVERGEV